MNFIIHPEAEAEFYEAVASFDLRVEGLGKDFAREVFATIDRILNTPFAWPLLSDNIHRCLSKRFPYSILYEIVDEDNLTILAVAHSSREPDYWKHRVA